MHTTDERALRICIGLLVAVSPLLLWLLLYLANRTSQLDLTAQISRIKVLRWIFYIAGLSLWLVCFFDRRYGQYWPLGTVAITASVGLSLPDSWLKKRLARCEEASVKLPVSATPPRLPDSARSPSNKPAPLRPDSSSPAPSPAASPPESDRSWQTPPA